MQNRKEEFTHQQIEKRMRILFSYMTTPTKAFKHLVNEKLIKPGEDITSISKLLNEMAYKHPYASATSGDGLSMDQCIERIRLLDKWRLVIISKIEKISSIISIPLEDSKKMVKAMFDDNATLEQNKKNISTFQIEGTTPQQQKEILEVFSDIIDVCIKCVNFLNENLRRPSETRINLDFFVRDFFFGNLYEELEKLGAIKAARTVEISTDTVKKVEKTTATCPAKGEEKTTNPADQKKETQTPKGYLSGLRGGFLSRPKQTAQALAKGNYRREKFSLAEMNQSLYVMDYNLQKDKQENTPDKGDAKGSNDTQDNCYLGVIFPSTVENIVGVINLRLLLDNKMKFKDSFFEAGEDKVEVAGSLIHEVFGSSRFQKDKKLFDFEIHLFKCKKSLLKKIKTLTDEESAELVKNSMKRIVDLVPEQYETSLQMIKVNGVFYKMGIELFQARQHWIKETKDSLPIDKDSFEIVMSYALDPSDSVINDELPKNIRIVTLP